MSASKPTLAEMCDYVGVPTCDCCGVVLALTDDSAIDDDGRLLCAACAAAQGVPLTPLGCADCGRQSCICDGQP